VDQRPTPHQQLERTQHDVNDLQTCFRLDLPYGRPPEALWGNTRVHWRIRQKDTFMVRNDVLTLAKQAGLHRLARPVTFLDLTLVWAPGDNRRRDEDNLFLLLKACADALARGPRKDWIGLEIVPDDTKRYMKKTPVLLDPPAKGMWLDIILTYQEDAA
jgi:crossover junction endodeoxyribonuclease RusA